MGQRGAAWAEPQPAQAPPHCTKCNSPLINAQCSLPLTVLLYNDSLDCGFSLPIKGLINSLCVRFEFYYLMVCCVISRLTVGKLLGEGAFGTVVKAQAVGIAGRNEISTVAVKMLKG